jgi:hypothetical protein
MAHGTPQRSSVPHTHAVSGASAAAELPADGTRPHPWELVQHPIKTVRFLDALRRDARVSGVRKLLYSGPLVLLLIALLLPEGIVAAIVALFVPLVGPLVNLPADAVLDWFAFGLAAYALLGVLPKGILAEHHARLFHPGHVARAEVRPHTVTP